MLNLKMLWLSFVWPSRRKPYLLFLPEIYVLNLPLKICQSNLNIFRLRTSFKFHFFKCAFVCLSLFMFQSFVYVFIYLEINKLFLKSFFIFKFLMTNHLAEYRLTCCLISLFKLHKRWILMMGYFIDFISLENSRHVCWIKQSYRH